MDLAFKTLDAYGLDPNRKAVCYWNFRDKRPQTHWECKVGTARYTVHITPAGDPINFVTPGWNPRAAVADSPYRLVSGAPVSTAPAPSASRFCWGGYTLAAVTIPAVHIPATTLPAVTIAGTHHPAQTLPAADLPAQTIPAQRVPRECFDAGTGINPADTNIRVRGYQALDQGFDPQLTQAYWSGAGDATLLPDPTAPGFGELNAAGFPKNQYVRPYFRRDGTFVSGYWRNSPSDGLPTCHVISC